jgi:hypothetical protein
MRILLSCASALALVVVGRHQQAPTIRFEPLAAGFPSAAIGATGAAWVDADNDGFVDVAISARDSSPNRVFRSVGGRLEEIPLAVDRGVNTNATAWGDVDGDGDQDLVMAQNYIVLYEARVEEGRLSFVRATDAGVLTSDARPRGAFEALAFSDIDTDGDLDLIAGAHGPAGSFVLLNDGRGRFSIARRDQFPFSSYMGGVHAVDLDNDRRGDLLFTGAPFPDFSVGTFAYWNDARDWRADRENVFSEQPGGLGSSIADVDGDGDLDLFVAGWGPRTPSALYLNQGGRRFVKSPVLFSPRVVGSAFADIDNDGDADLITSGGYTDPGKLEVWLGDGRGGFTAADVPGFTDVPGRFTGLTVVDFDRDGRLDVFVASRRDSVRFFRNVSEGVGGWLDVELRSANGGVPVWGARVALELATPSGARRIVASIHQQSGYAGHGEPVAHFGIPANARVVRAIVAWSNGQQTTVAAPSVSRRHVVNAPRFVAPTAK